MHEAARSTLDELRLFLRTLWGITVRPSRFAEAWADGSERAQNPLAFLATCASLLTALLQLLRWSGAPVADDASIADQLVATAGPFVQYAAAGVLAHVALLGVGPRRRLLDSLAIGLYSGGPALCGYVLVGSLMGIIWVRLGRPEVHHGLSNVSSPWMVYAFNALWVVVLLFVRSLWLGLAGLHRGRLIVSGLATLIAMTVIGLVFGALETHGPFGIQLVLRVGHHPFCWIQD